MVVLGFVFVGCLAVLGGGGGETAGGAGGGAAAGGSDGQEQAAQQEDQGSQEEAEAAQQQAEEEAAAQEAAEREAEQEAEAERRAAEERERQEAAAAAEAAIGETVRAGDAEWTVTSANRTNVLKQKGFDQFGESKQGDFVVMDFTFTNLANEAVTLDTISLPLFDSEGRQYEADTDTFGYVPAQKDIFLNQVNPGVTQEGRIIYSVAPGSKGFQVRAGDLTMFGDEEAKINLGF